MRFREVVLNLIELHQTLSFKFLRVRCFLDDARSGDDTDIGIAAKGSPNGLLVGNDAAFMKHNSGGHFITLTDSKDRPIASLNEVEDGKVVG